MTFINFLMSAIAVGANLISNINSNQNNNNNNNNDNNDNVANFNFVNNNNGGNNQNTIQICKYILVTVTPSGILKGKQKLGRTFNSDKLGGIAFTKISKLTMCSA